MAECVFCGEEAIPGRPDVLYAISGFEEPRTEGGANMIHLRHRMGPVAHLKCVDEAKPRQRVRVRAKEPTIDFTRTYSARAATCASEHPEAVGELPFDPDWVVHPGATLREWRKEKGLTIAEAALACIMTPERYEGIERGLVAYGQTDAFRLARGTETEESFWVRREQQFRDGLAAGKTWTR
jgi:hypothetical protein